MDLRIRDGALHMDHGGTKRRSRKPHARVVRKAEAFLWNSEEIAVQVRVAVLVVNGGDPVIAGGKVFPYYGGLALAGRDRGGAAAVGFFRVFGPSIRRGEEDRADHACGVAQAINTNAQCAPG